MDLGTYMMRYQPNDPLAVGSDHCPPCIGNFGAQPVYPEPSVRIEHDLDDGGIAEPGFDLGTKGSTQHARAAR